MELFCKDAWKSVVRGVAREVAHSLSTLGLRSSHPGDLEGSRLDSI